MMRMAEDRHAMTGFRTLMKPKLLKCFSLPVAKFREIELNFISKSSLVEPWV